MNDPRIRRGLERQFRDRSRLLAEGHQPLGWKAGFGAPAARDKMGLDGPLLGFMTDGSVLADGATVDITGWARPVAEPELAVWIGGDLSEGEDAGQVREAIIALAPAIEVADVDPPPEEVEEVLAANIFHRGVVLGARDPARAGADLDGLQPRITVDGDEVEPPTDMEHLTGRLVDVVSHLAGLALAAGEQIRAGDVVICGSITPPLSLFPGAEVEFHLAPFDPISVRTA